MLDLTLEIDVIHWPCMGYWISLRHITLECGTTNTFIPLYTHITYMHRVQETLHVSYHCLMKLLPMFVYACVFIWQVNKDESNYTNDALY